MLTSNYFKLICKSFYQVTNNMPLNARAIIRRNTRQRQSKSLRVYLFLKLLRKRLNAMKQDRIMGSFISRASNNLETSFKLADYQNVYEQLIAFSDMGRTTVLGDADFEYVEEDDEPEEVILVYDTEPGTASNSLDYSD